MKATSLPLATKYLEATNKELDRLEKRIQGLLMTISEYTAQGRIPTRWDLDDMTQTTAEIEAHKRAKSRVEDAFEFDDVTDSKLAIRMAWELIQDHRGADMHKRQALDEVGRMINNFLLGKVA